MLVTITLDINNAYLQDWPCFVQKNVHWHSTNQTFQPIYSMFLGVTQAFIDV
jgi:hypothetical protein